MITHLILLAAGLLIGLFSGMEISNRVSKQEERERLMEETTRHAQELRQLHETMEHRIDELSKDFAHAKFKKKPVTMNTSVTDEAFMNDIIY